MKIIGQELVSDDVVEQVEITGVARGPGVLLTIPRHGKDTVRVLVTWDELRKAMPLALAEFAPKMAASAARRTT